MLEVGEGEVGRGRYTVSPGSGAVMRTVKRLPSPPWRGDGGFTQHANFPLADRRVKAGALAAFV